MTPEELTEENFEQLSYSLVISKFVQPLKEKGVKESTIKSLKTKDTAATEPISESELKELEAWVKNHYDDERGLGWST